MLAKINKKVREKRKKYTIPLSFLHKRLVLLAVCNIFKNIQKNFCLQELILTWVEVFGFGQFNGGTSLFL